MTEEQIGNLIAELISSQGGFALVAGAVWWYGSRMLKHTCALMPRVLDVVEKVAKDGVTVRVHLVEDDANSDAQDSTTSV